MENKEKIIKFLKEEGWSLFNSMESFKEYLDVKYGATKATSLEYGINGIGVNGFSDWTRSILKPLEMVIAFNEGNEKNSINRSGNYKQLLYNAGYKSEFELLEVKNWEEAFNKYEINGKK